MLGDAEKNLWADIWWWSPQYELSIHDMIAKLLFKDRHAQKKGQNRDKTNTRKILNISNNFYGIVSADSNSRTSLYKKKKKRRKKINTGY